MEHASHPDIVKRLKRAHGHLAGVIAMIEEGRPCVDLAQQIHAVESAITNAKRVLIQDHMEHCIGHGMENGAKGATAALAEFKTWRSTCKAHPMLSVLAPSDLPPPVRGTGHRPHRYRPTHGCPGALGIPDRWRPRGDHPRDRTRHQDDSLCPRRPGGPGLHGSATPTLVSGRHGPRPRCHRPDAALRRPDLADLRPDLRPAIGLGSVHADLPGDHPGHPAQRAGLHTCPLALSPCLRPGEPTQPDARRSSPDRGALQRVVRRHRRRLPVLGRPGCVGDLAFRRPDRPPGVASTTGRRAASGSICRRRACAGCSP